jgi:hypothetical protein
LVDGTEIEGEVGARIQAALDKFDKERRRRLFIDGEVITMNGRVVDPDRVSDTIRDRGD